MLINLNINNILLIESCSLDFSANLCIITGETGAGKSMLLDSLLFVLGVRANAKIIRHQEPQAIVSAEFSIKDNLPVLQLLEELGITATNNLIIRRSISNEGKSKNFINDIPVSLMAVKNVTDHLIEIHSQNEQRGLLDNGTHRSVLDAYGDYSQMIEEVSRSYFDWQQAIVKYQELQENLEKIKHEEDYLSYVVKEIRQLDLRSNEEQDLSDKRTKLMSKEKVVSIINNALSDLSGKNNPSEVISSTLRTLSRNNNIPNISFDHIIDILDRAVGELAEAGNELEALSNSFNDNDENLDEVEKRLFGLKAIARKYNVTVEGLSEFLVETQQKLKLLTKQESNLKEAKLEVERSYQIYVATATKLSKARKTTASKLEETIISELKLVKMPNTRFNINIEALPEASYNSHGIDKITFLFSSNPGMDLAPLSKIASGGELSRFTLAAKIALSNIKSTKTIVFDEIDTGIGGAVADSVGLRLKTLGQSMQVIAITHQPQIAAKADLHIHVSKKQTGQNTKTIVNILSKQERSEEIARMLAGETITEEARAAADKLLI